MKLNEKNIFIKILYYIYIFLLCLIATFKHIFFKRKNENIIEKKIMILIGKISKGGAERAAVNLAEKLSKKYEVLIVTFNTKEFKNIEEYKCNVKQVHLETSKYGKIKTIKKENNITHCISFGTNANFINAITKTNDKVIISIRNYISIAEKKNKLKIKNKIASKLCDYVVAVSKEVEEDYIKTYKVNKNKICTIYNYCNKEYIEESIEKYDIDEENKKIFENSKVIITVGKLKEQKGQWHLIRAFKKVVEKHKDAKLMILGVGKLEGYLKKLVKEMNLENYIYILGHKNKNIYTYMKKSNIFAFPTLYEGMPNVILEAMECGLPIIATDCYGGNKEIIEPNNKKEIKDIEKCKYGILVPKLDFKYYNANDKLTKEELMLANAINEMLENEELLEYYKQKSLQRVNDFNKESYIEKWEEIL